MITLERDHLVFRFPEVHPHAQCRIGFQRTLRIPDDGRDYPLPPGLGGFPLRHLDDHAARLPEGWLKRGGVVMPMHQAEALWLNFDGRRAYPCAVKVATGKIDALTGEPWTGHLNRHPQDYLVLPEQPWLDGYCVEKGTIRQFVAMPLGEGYSAEEQLTGAAQHGGLQIVVYPMKAERYEELLREREGTARRRAFRLEQATFAGRSEPDMGLAPGGRMTQEVYDDPHGLEAWDQRHGSRCFVTVANSATWLALTGERPPQLPPSARDYSRAGLPWFDYYGGDAAALKGTSRLAGLKSVAEMGEVKGAAPLPENHSAEVERLVALRRQGPARVREADL